MANKTTNKNKKTTKKPLVTQNTITEKPSAFLAYKDMIPFNKWITLSVIIGVLLVLI